MSPYKQLLLLTVLVLTFANVTHAAVPDTMTITDKSGAGETSYPLQFGRPFVQGEIVNYPQVLVNGSPLTTQADVKNRYPDGSVKFAIISVVLPSIPANGSVTLSFQNQSTGNNTPLTQTQMLGTNFNFDATINLTSLTGATQTASARTMLTNGDYSYWTSGPVATTILLADDSTARKYDMGFDSYKPIRPRFYATFWPTLNKVTVRYVGENALTTAAEDIQISSMAFTLGQNLQQVYATSSAKLVIPRFTRFTKTFWIGGVPQNMVNIDYNLPYLDSTNYLPNFDTSMTVPDSTIANEYSSWQTHPHDLYQGGFWTTYMPTTGSRDDIGPMPTWTTRWLYTGDWRAREIALGLADLAGAWEWNVREGNSAMKIDKAQTISGLGLPISIYAYPNVWVPDNNGGWGQLTTLPTTPLIVTNPNEYPTTGYGFVAETAHAPDPYYAQYLLTGDYYYLESLQNWAATNALGYCPGSGVGSWCRGTGIAGIADQVRGNGWTFRNRANAEVLTPDSQTTLKNFYTQMTNEAIAFWEGKAGVTGTAFQGTPAWQQGNQDYFGSDPLHLQSCSMGITGCVSNNEANWQDYYDMTAFGMEAERGIPIGSYLNWLGSMLTGQIGAANYDPYNLGSYYFYETDASASWYPSWAAVQTANIPGGPCASLGNGCQMKTTGGWSNDTTYPTLATAAASFLGNLPNGTATWNWLNTNLKQPAIAGTLGSGAASFFDGTGEISWNLLPRSGTVSTQPYVTLSASPTSITTGGSATLSWSSSNATSCAGTGFSASGTSGSVSVMPSVTTTYSITCTGAGGSASASATVTVGSATQAPTATLTANPTSITSGQSSTLSWTSTNATSCTGTGFTASGTSGSVSVMPSVTTTYSITCTGAGGSSTASAAVTVGSSGGTGTLPWAPASNVLIATTSNATLVAQNGINYVEAIGGTNNTAVLTQPSSSANVAWFSITYNPDGTVTVVDTHASGYTVNLWDIQTLVFPAGDSTTLSSTATPTATLTASPTSINSGQSSTLTWSSTNATSCTGTGFTASGTSGSIVVAPTVTTTYSVNCSGAVSSATVTVSAVTSNTSTITIGSRVYTIANLNVRNKPNIKSGKILCVQPMGAAGTVTSGPSGANGYIWWYVKFDTSCSGYVVQNYLSLTTGVVTTQSTVGTASAGAAITHTLAKSWSGPEVSLLQLILSKLGFFTPPPTGYFGDQTAAAVSAFQSAHNLEPVGVVGPKTRVLLNQAQ